MARTRINDLERELSSDELRLLFGGRGVDPSGHVCDDLCPEGCEGGADLPDGEDGSKPSFTNLKDSGRLGGGEIIDPTLG